MSDLVLNEALAKRQAEISDEEITTALNVLFNAGGRITGAVLFMTVEGADSDTNQMFAAVQVTKENALTPSKIVELCLMNIRR